MTRPTLRITNATRTSILATHADIASTREEKLNGLIGVSAQEFQPGAGLFFEGCNAIHTVQMSMNIDVLFIDMLTHRVQKALSDAPPTCHFNTRIPPELSAVLELPAGVIAQSGTRVGDVIVIMSSSHCSQEELSRISSLWPHSA